MTRIRSTDSSRVEDRRGQGGGGGMSFPGFGTGGMGFPMKSGGGLLGLLVIAAIIFLPRLLNGDGNSTQLAPTNQGQTQSGSGQGACESELEQTLCGANNDAQDFWTREFPTAFGKPYQDATMVFFTGATNTGCGQGSAETGPFYCPADGRLYIDLDFLVQLQDQFGAPGDLATQYIVAHELGHHIQNLSGQNAVVEQATGDRQRMLGIALELQADCYAGVWANDASKRTTANGQPLIDEGEISEALNAAAAVGDDRIQQQTQGRVTPETFTHGTAEQREGWFRRGYSTGDPAQCDTFSEV